MATLCAVALVACSSGVAVAAAQSVGQEQALEQERAELEENRHSRQAAQYQLDQLERSDVDLAASIDEAAAALEVAAAELSMAEQHFAESYRVLQEARNDLAEARQRVVVATEEFRRRAARAAAHPQLVPDAAIFTTDDPMLFAKRAIMSRVVLEGDVLAMTELEAARRQRDADVSRLDQAAEASSAARDEARARHGDVEARQAELEAARQALQVRIAESQAEVEALARQEAELVALIAQQEEAARAAAAAEAEAEAAAAGGSGEEESSEDDGEGGGGGGALRWPARGWVSSEFGPRWGRNHNGLDIAAPTGTSVLAAASGVVFHGGPLGSFGNLVAIDHGGGQTTFYGHLATVEVVEGQWVEAGERVAGVGSTGRSTGPHLHFEVRLGGVPQNPRQFLG